MVVWGCSLWNSAASFFISGEFPTHEKNETSVGSVGSCTGPGPSPFGSCSGPSELLPPQAARPKEVIDMTATTAATLRDSLNLTEPLLAHSGGSVGDPRMRPDANRLASWREASLARRSVSRDSSGSRHAPVISSRSRDLGWTGL